MRCLKAACCAAAVVLLFAPNSRADEWNKKTILTFSGPVQIPGTTLGAGTYVFKLADLESNRHVVQVMDKDEKHVYGLLLAIPNQRLQPSDDPVVLFAERSAGSPQAIRAWFYPGETIGNEFVYPKDQAMKIAKDTHQSVLSMDDRSTPSTTDEERMTAMRGATVNRVDEHGAIAENNSQPPAVATTGTTERTPAAQENRPATTTAPKSSSAATTTSGTTANATVGSTAAEPSVGTTASKDASLKNSSGRAARNRSASATAVGTSGQAARSNAKLPKTASNLTLFELLSGIAIAAGLGVRRVRLATSR
jgi:hypothetical protein